MKKVNERRGGQTQPINARQKCEACTGLRGGGGGVESIWPMPPDLRNIQPAGKKSTGNKWDVENKQNRNDPTSAISPAPSSTWDVRAHTHYSLYTKANLGRALGRGECDGHSAIYLRAHPCCIG